MKQYKQQRGVYTIVVSVLIVAVSMLALRGVTKSAVVEERIATNEEEFKEVMHAAEAALDYGIAMYAKQDPTWNLPTTGTIEWGVANPAPPVVAYTNDDGNAKRSYTASVRYERDNTNALSEGYVEIIAIAASTTNAEVTATVRQYVHDNYILGDPGFGTAPLMVKGCLTNVTGTPDLFVDNDFDDGIISLQNSSSTCVDPGHAEVYYPGDPDNLGNPGQSNPNSQGFDEITPTEDSIGYANNPTGDLWEYVFSPSMTRTEVKKQALEQEQDLARGQRTIMWIDYGNTEYLSSNNFSNSNNGGSPSAPVIIVFSDTWQTAGQCPGFQGNIDVYGIIFVDADCPDGNGWGNLTVYGSVAINGDLNQPNAQTNYVNAGGLFANDGATLKSDWVARIPGSWRDFN